MNSKTMQNASTKPVQFSIAGAPGAPVQEFDVPPGATCEVPEGYVKTGLIRRIAPGLVPADEAPPKQESKPAEEAPPSPFEPAPSPKKAKGKKATAKKKAAAPAAEGDSK